MTQTAMNRLSLLLRLLVVMAAFVFLAILPLPAHAQSAFTGVVKDPTGAVLGLWKPKKA